MVLTSCLTQISIIPGGIPYGSVSGNVAAYFRPGGATYDYKPGVSRRFGSNNFNYDFFSRDFD